MTTKFDYLKKVMVKNGASDNFKDWHYEAYYYYPSDIDYGIYANPQLEFIKPVKILNDYDLQNYASSAGLDGLHRCICSQDGLHHHHVFLSKKNNGIIVVGSQCVKHFDLPTYRKMKKVEGASLKHFKDIKEEIKLDKLKQYKHNLRDIADLSFLNKTFVKKKKSYICFTCHQPWSPGVGCSNTECK